MKKIVVDFSRYSVVGIVISVLVVLFTWLFIDVIGINTIVATSIIVVIFHVIKFILYRKVSLFVGEEAMPRQFIIYTAVVILSSFMHIVLIWFFIDIIRIPTLVSAAVVVAGLFVFRFFLFNYTHLLDNDESPWSP